MRKKEETAFAVSSVFALGWCLDSRGLVGVGVAIDETVEFLKLEIAVKGQGGQRLVPPPHQLFQVQLIEEQRIPGWNLKTMPFSTMQ